MSIAQQSRIKNPTPPANVSWTPDPTPRLRYEFILKVQSRDIICTLYKTVYAPNLPLSCDNVTIGTGIYSIVRTRVDFDDATVYVWLAPLVIHRHSAAGEVEAVGQVIKELKEGLWHE